MIYGFDLSPDASGGEFRRFRSDLNGAKKAIHWGMASSNRRLYVLKNRRFSRRSYNALQKAGIFGSFMDYSLSVLESEARRVTPDDLRRIYFG